jgi:restriction system protein
VQAGILYRFLHEVQDGDVVVYPSKTDRLVNIGRFAGAYRFDREGHPEYPNIRPVEWKKHIPRDQFSQAALYEIGSFITLFSIRNHVEEFIAALEERSISEPAEDTEEREDDETVAKSASIQAQETTTDFVTRQLKTGIDSYQFECFIAHLLQCMGYFTRVTAKSRDGGVDVIAHKDQLGFEPPVIKVQCKQVTNTIGQPEVSQLIGNVENGEHGLFVTLGGYSRDARQYEQSKHNLRLIDGEQLVELIFDNYPSFEPRYQALLPLKRIYVPSLQDGGV